MKLEVVVLHHAGIAERVSEGRVKGKGRWVGHE